MLFSTAIILVASAFALGLILYFIFDRRGRQLPIILHPVSYGIIALIYTALEVQEITEFELFVLIILCMVAFYGPSVLHYYKETKNQNSA